MAYKYICIRIHRLHRSQNFRKPYSITLNNYIHFQELCYGIGFLKLEPFNIEFPKRCGSRISYDIIKFEQCASYVDINVRTQLNLLQIFYTVSLQILHNDYEFDYTWCRIRK